MKTIGGSIQEAIDWTQDHLRTTRPLAEETLFSMLAAKSVAQTEAGFVLLEDDDEADEHHNKTRLAFRQNKFHYNSRRGRIHRMSSRNHMKSDAAENMMAVDKGHHKKVMETPEISPRGRQAIAEAALKMGISYSILETICSDKSELE